MKGSQTRFPLRIALVSAAVFLGASLALAQQPAPPARLPDRPGTVIAVSPQNAGPHAAAPQHGAVLPAESSVPSCCAPAAEAAAPAFGGPLHCRPNLTGDWHGFRNHLAEKGITFDTYFTQFYQGVTAGGRDRDWEYGGKLDYLLNVDGQKLGLWQGFFINFHAETRYGQTVNGIDGLILPSNIAMLFPKPGENVTAVTGVKFTQALSENFIVYAGKLNLLDDYKQRFANGRGVDTFMNTSLVFNPIFARTTPYSTFGVGFAVLQEKEPLLAVSILDPQEHATTFALNDPYERGAVVLAQATLPVKLAGLAGHQSVGAVWSSADYRSIDPSSFLLIPGQGLVAGTETNSWAVFYAFDQYLVTDHCDPKRGWGVFGNAGISDGNPNPIHWFVSAGVGGNSPVSGRGADTFGVGYFYNGLSGDFKALVRPLVHLQDEHGAEVFYNIAVTPWCYLTADVQFVNPAVKAFDTSIIAGLRLKIVF